MHRTLIVLLLVLVGCEAKSTADSSEADKKKDRIESEQESDPGLLDAAKSLYAQAKEAGTTKADSAQQWLSDTLKRSADASEAATGQSVEFITEQFNRAKSAGETSASTAKEWVLEDIQNVGRWEYTELTVKSSSSAATIVKKMNELGRERWECIFVDRQNAMTTFYFKRTAHSYVKHIPARELLRLVPFLGGGADSQ